MQDTAAPAESGWRFTVLYFLFSAEEDGNQTYRKHRFFVWSIDEASGLGLRQPFALT